MKRKIGEVVLQIIPVMIGVYLGFVVSNWAEARKTKSQTELLRQNLVAEIKLNKSKISDVLAYHTMLRDNARAFRSKKAGTENRPGFFKGTRTVTLANSAFNTSIQTGLINNLEFGEIQAINDVYTQQTAYNEFKTLLLSGLMSISFGKNHRDMMQFNGFLAATMTDVVIQENRLTEDYDELLQKLEPE